MTSKLLPSSTTTNKHNAQTAKNLLQDEADWGLHPMLEAAQYTYIKTDLKIIFSQHYKFLAMFSWKVTVEEPLSRAGGNERKNKPSLRLSQIAKKK